MSGSTAKRIREAVKPNTPFKRQVYRKLKKYYTSKVPAKHRDKFLETVEDTWYSIIK